MIAQNIIDNIQVRTTANLNHYSVKTKHYNIIYTINKIMV